jgi:membrane-associated PAP2 superfamily phosphatase
MRRLNPGWHACAECGRACLALCDCERQPTPAEFAAGLALAIGLGAGFWLGLARLLEVLGA